MESLAEMAGSGKKIWSHSNSPRNRHGAGTDRKEPI